MSFSAAALRRGALGLAALGSIAGSIFASPQAHGITPKKVVHSYTLTTGVTLRTIHYSTPNEVRVLIIHPQSGPSMEEVAAGDFGSWVPVSKQGVNNGATAAVNGDFGSFSRMPSHWNLVDGELRTSGVMANQGFAWNESGSRAWASSPSRRIHASAPAGPFKIDHLNAGHAGPAEIVAFTPVGGSKEKPAANGMCSAKLAPAGPYAWSNATKSGSAGHTRLPRSPPAARPSGSGRPQSRDR